MGILPDASLDNAPTIPVCTLSDASLISSIAPPAGVASLKTLCCYLLSPSFHLNKENNSKSLITSKGPSASKDSLIHKSLPLKIPALTIFPGIALPAFGRLSLTSIIFTLEVAEDKVNVEVVKGTSNAVAAGLVLFPQT